MPPSQVPTAVPCGMNRSSLLTSLGWVLAGGAGLALLAAGCGSSHHRSAPSTSTTTDPATAAVLAAYRGAQTAFDQALAQADPAWPALAETMTGAQLESVRRILVADQMNGIVGRGSVQVFPKLVSITGSTAVVHDCLYSSSELVYAKTGKPVPPATPPEHDGVMAVVQEVAPGTWKVANVHVTEGTCPPGY